MKAIKKKEIVTRLRLKIRAGQAKLARNSERLSIIGQAARTATGLSINFSGCLPHCFTGLAF